MQMSPSRFKREFKRGLGSALLALVNSDDREAYFETVLWCCLHNTCYDPQSEGERSIYLCDAIDLFDDHDRFETAIIERFNEKIKDYGLHFHLAGMLRIFAQEGSEQARVALIDRHNALFLSLSSHQKVNNAEKQLFEILCIDLMQLLGFAFFREVTNRVGLYWAQNDFNTESIDLPWFVSVAETQFGKKRFVQYLTKHAKKSEAPAAFLQLVQQYDGNISSERAKPTLEQYLMREDADVETVAIQKHMMSRRIAYTLLPEELVIIAQRAVKEEDLDFRAALLQIFEWTPFPLDEKYLFEFADSDNERLRQITFKMMELVRKDSVHDFALDKLRRDENIAEIIRVLCMQYKPQDETLIFDKLKNVPVKYNDIIWHKAYISVEDAVEHSRRKPQTDILLYMYRNTLCSFCRGDIVRLMHKKCVLPREVLEECIWDCNIDTRRWAERLLKRKNGQRL